MKLEITNINQIKESFASMKSKEDFLILLNYSKRLVYGENAVPFDIKQLNYYSNSNINKNRYISFAVRKKSGEDRVIHAPKRGLKAIQKCLNLILQVIYQPHKAASGFVPGKSIVDNAKIHTGSIYVYNMDLKDFFPSIDQARIWGRLRHAPFNLNESNGNVMLANIIAALCCQEMIVERKDENGEWIKVIKNVLPQGAPTSPLITNIICERLDIKLSGVAKRFGLKYSRYADDITFSSMHNVYQKNSDFLVEVQRIITEQNFTIKESKTRLQKEGYRQEVTGLLVNDKVNVQKRYIKQLRMWLYLIEKYGYSKANSYFSQHYFEDKGHVKNLPPVMQNVIAGKLEYLKMVKGNDNALYVKLKNRFDKLFANENTITNILDIWEKEGIEKAMEIYYQPTIENQSNEIISDVEDTETDISFQDNKNTWINETPSVILSKEVEEVVIVGLDRSKETPNCLFVSVLMEDKTVGSIAVAYDKHKDLKTGKALATLVKFSGVNKFNPDKPNESITFKNISKQSLENDIVDSDAPLINNLKRFQLIDNSLKSYVHSQDIKEITIEDNLVKLLAGNKALKLQLTVAKNRLPNLPAVFDIQNEEELSKWVIFNHPTNKKIYLAYIGDIEFIEI
jgi:hypothetical protein